MNNDVPLHTFHMARSACTAAPKAAIIALAQVARSSVWCHYGHCGHCDKTWWNPLTISDRTKKDCGSMFKIEMQDWLRPWLLGHAWSLRLSSFWSLPWGGGVKAIQRLGKHPLKKLGKIEHFPTNKDSIWILHVFVQMYSVHEHAKLKNHEESTANQSPEGLISHFAKAGWVLGNISPQTGVTQPEKIRKVMPGSARMLVGIEM